MYISINIFINNKCRSCGSCRGDQKSWWKMLDILLRYNWQKRSISHCQSSTDWNWKCE